MENPIEHYWQRRLEDLKDALETNNFQVFVTQTSEEATKVVIERILPETGAVSVSWGGSMTVIASGCYAALKDRTDITVLDTFDKSISPEAMLERRRQALLVDVFITGTNAVTETGYLVNLDRTGNRIAALTFGPRYVVVMVGRNKVVPDTEEAMIRIKNYVAPANAMRLDTKTPCVTTSYCEDCKSPERICSIWTITEKSYPKGRVKVVLINQDLGL